jgi:lysyl-tRNA synthetase class 1
MIDGGPEADGTDDAARADTAGPATDADGEAEHAAFWADAVADEVAARLDRVGREPGTPVVVKGGVSPSGIPHIGHLNEILRGHYVADVLRERGYEVRQVFTSDDRDALRKLPRLLADDDWNLVELGDVDAGALGRNLGVPYTSIPDPFGDCHDSYGAHFADLLARSAEMVGVDVEMLSNTELYEDGSLEAATRTALSDLDRAREVLSAYQDGVDESYVPFMAVCESCGRLTTGVRGVDVDAGELRYECVGLEAGDRVIEGCGHEGVATLREGKLPWRFEWPAQWATLGVDFEPFGKDHAEGSWPSGEEIARRVFDIEPPTPMTYEWFTLNGEALSSSAGNVVTADEALSMLEPEVLRYFFALDPNKARDFDVERLDQLVDGFDRFERAYFGAVDDERLSRFAERAYPFVMADPDADGEGPFGGVRARRVRLPYTFAAVLGMVDDEAVRERMARNEGHIPEDAPQWAVEEALDRVEKARNWAERTGNEYDYRLQLERPDVGFDDATAAALDDLAEFVAAGHDGEAIQGEMYEVARRHDVDVGDFFGAGYRLFFDRTDGPRLGEFLGQLDREFVVARLRREA